MGTNGLDALVMRAVRDCDFRQLLESKPEYAFSGFDLSSEEKTAIMRVASTLNDRGPEPEPMAYWR